MVDSILDILFYIIIGIATFLVVLRLFFRIYDQIATNKSIVLDTFTIAIGIILLAGKYVGRF